MCRPRRCAPLCRPEVGVPSRPRASSWGAGPLGKGADCRAGKKQMAANRRFAAGDFGGKCERGLPPFTFGARREPRADAGAEAAGVGATPTPVASDSAINNDQSELAPRPRRAREFRFPEPGGVGSRVPRPQHLLLRGLRAALAALRKPARSAGRSAGGACVSLLFDGRIPSRREAPSADRSTYRNRASCCRLRR